MAEQLDTFYTDLADPNMVSALAMVHSRYSTNTFPTWALAHPYRIISHNGEINALRGNINWMHAREMQFVSEAFGDDLKKILPIIEPGGSDSAASVTNFELLPCPPKERAQDNPWQQWSFIERTSSSREEGCERDFCVMTKEFSGEDGKLEKLHAVRLEFGEKDPKTGRGPMKEIPGSEFEVGADLVLLAPGFLGPVKSGLLEDFGVALDERGNVKTDVSQMTSIPKVFSAGDMRRCQSLVVWAI